MFTAGLQSYFRLNTSQIYVVTAKYPHYIYLSANLNDSLTYFNLWVHSSYICNIIKKRAPWTFSECFFKKEKTPSGKWRFTIGEWRVLGVSPQQIMFGLP